MQGFYLLEYQENLVLKMDKRLGLIQNIYQYSVSISNIRKDLLIDESSALYRLKSMVFHKSSANSAKQDFKSLKMIELRTIIGNLNTYQSKLIKIRALLFPLLYIKNLLLSFYTHALFKNELTIKAKNRTLLIVFGVIPFTFRVQRPQQLVYAIKEKLGATIVYIDPSFIFNSTSLLNTYSVKNTNDIHVVKIGTSQEYNIQLQEITRGDQLRVMKVINKIVEDTNANKVICKIDHPFWFFVVENSKYPSIYDCMDDHTSFEVGSLNLAALERTLLKKTSAVIVTSQHLYKKVSLFRKDSINIIRNGCEYKHFNHLSKYRKVPQELKKIQGPILGYYGAIAEWFNHKLIIDHAKKYPTHNFVLIGEVTHKSILEEAKQYSNIYFLGEKKYSELPGYLRYFDVCLIPFHLNNVIKATNPVKIYEYLAAGKPVVTTDIPELRHIRELIYISKNAKEFSQTINLAINDRKKRLLHERTRFAMGNTWHSRGNELLKIISALL